MSANKQKRLRWKKLDKHNVSYLTYGGTRVARVFKLEDTDEWNWESLVFGFSDKGGDFGHLDSAQEAAEAHVRKLKEEHPAVFEADPEVAPVADGPEPEEAP